MKPKRKMVVAREPVNKTLHITVLQIRYSYVTNKFKSCRLLTSVKVQGAAS
jgi:hypothetical protein